jgi:hypothetical protein
MIPFRVDGKDDEVWQRSAKREMLVRDELKSRPVRVRADAKTWRQEKG